MGDLFGFDQSSEVVIKFDFDFYEGYGGFRCSCYWLQKKEYKFWNQIWI